MACGAGCHPADLQERPAVGALALYQPRFCRGFGPGTTDERPDLGESLGQGRTIEPPTVLERNTVVDRGRRELHVNRVEVRIRIELDDVRPVYPQTFHQVADSFIPHSRDLEQEPLVETIRHELLRLPEILVGPPLLDPREGILHPGKKRRGVPLGIALLQLCKDRLEVLLFLQLHVPAE